MALVVSLLIDLTMALLYLHFAAAHVSVFYATHSWQVGLIVAQETLVMILFLVRWLTVAISPVLADWTIAGVGTFAPLLLRPTGVTPPATALQIAGLCVSLASLASLRRSFGIVPACRRAVTSGLYAIVRHPQYAGHQLLLLGYLLASPTVWNTTIVCMTISALWYRMFAEEAVLQAASAEYRAYCQRVTSRVIPGVL
jgi:protein-S-isoprenylcysteine O-methyltransferase Ste14